MYIYTAIIIKSYTYAIISIPNFTKTYTIAHISNVSIIFREYLFVTELVVGVIIFLKSSADEDDFIATSKYRFGL